MADLFGGFVDHELTRMDLLNMAREDELDTPEAQALFKELHRNSDKLDETMAAYDNEYGMPEPLEADDNDEDDRYDGFQPEPFYDHLETQYDKAKEDGLFEVLRVLKLDEEHSDKGLVEAVNYHNQNEGNIKENAPVGIFNKYEQRMIQDLKLQGYAEKTRQSYVAAVKALAGYHNRSSDQLDEEQIREYFLSLIENKKAAKSTVTIYLCGIKFFYEKTLGKKFGILGLVRPKRRKKLPLELYVSAVIHGVTV